MFMIKAIPYLILIIFLCSCSVRKQEYNLGIATDTTEELRNVDLTMKPKGSHPGRLLMNRQGTSWYMMITHWTPPEEITVTFMDPSGTSNKLIIETGLSGSFCGDILVVIRKVNGKYVLGLKTGKLNSLTSIDERELRDLFKLKS